MKLFKLTKLAEELGVSYSTVMRWRAQGYEPEYGSHTTVAHCLDWLKARKSAKALETKRLIDLLA